MILFSSIIGNLWGIFVWLALGALVGWVASIFFGSKGGLVKYIIIGILGSLLGGFLGSLIPINTGGLMISFFLAVVGSGILIIVLRFFKIIK